MKVYDKNKSSYDTSKLLLFVILSTIIKGENKTNFVKVLKLKIPRRGLEGQIQFPNQTADIFLRIKFKGSLLPRVAFKIESGHSIPY